MRQLKLIGIAGLLVVVVLAGVPLVFTRGGTQDDVRTFDEKLGDILDQYTFQYVAPEALAGVRVDEACRGPLVQPKSTECQKFIESIRSLDPMLADLLARLEEIIAGTPPGVSSDSTQVAEDLFNQMGISHEANALLLSGWDSHDFSKWQKGWELRDTLKDENSSATTP